MSSADPHPPAPPASATSGPDLARFAEPVRFTDRRQAGRELAEALRGYQGADPLVLGLPRGGIPVAFEVARALGAALDVWGARRIRVPIAPELAVAAVAEGGMLDLELDAIAEASLTPNGVRAAAAGEHAALAQQLERLRGARRAPEVRGRTVILVDDLIATGATARAALLSLRSRSPLRLVLATPAAATGVVRTLRPLCDEVVVLARLERLEDPSHAYASPEPLDEAGLRALLDQAPRRAREERRLPVVESRSETLLIEGRALEAHLARPEGARAVAVLVGAELPSQLRESLWSHGLATIRFAPEVAEPQLEAAIAAACELGVRSRMTCDLPLGAVAFGAAAATLLSSCAAVRDRSAANALVLVEANTTPADRTLLAVRAPTLLLAREKAGARTLHRWIAERLGGLSELAVLPPSPQLFEGEALDALVQQTCRWLLHHLVPRRPSGRLWG